MGRNMARVQSGQSGHAGCMLSPTAVTNSEPEGKVQAAGHSTAESGKTGGDAASASRDLWEIGVDEEVPSAARRDSTAWGS